MSIADELYKAAQIIEADYLDTRVSYCKDDSLLIDLVLTTMDTVRRRLDERQRDTCQKCGFAYADTKEQVYCPTCGTKRVEVTR